MSGRLSDVEFSQTGPEIEWKIAVCVFDIPVNKACGASSVQFTFSIGLLLATVLASSFTLCMMVTSLPF